MKKIHTFYNRKVMDRNLKDYYEVVATNVESFGSNIKSIVLTSVNPGEGKSSVSINLAKALADKGYKVLLFDADTRNSELDTMFRIESDTKLGLTSYLLNETGIENIIYATDINNLSIIPAIKHKKDDFLEHPNFELMLGAFVQYYDYVIVDSADMDTYDDAEKIAEMTDASILVTEPSSVKKEVLNQTIEILEKTGSIFLGVILNKVDINSSVYSEYKLND